ncbi:MAG: DedA family protein [Stellaceae bacterium]
MPVPLLAWRRSTTLDGQPNKKIPSLLSDIFTHVHHAIAHYGYVAVMLGILLEDFGLPTPGETLLVAGAIAASQGDLNIWLLLFLGWLGGVIGDNIGYWIGHSGGHRLMLRYGGRIGITEAKLKQVEGFFARYGGWVIVFARFVVVARQFNGIVAGTLEMPWWRFVGLNAIGAALWVGFWGGLAYALGKRFYSMFHHIDAYRTYIYILLGLALVVVAAYFVWRRWGRTRPKNI